MAKERIAKSHMGFIRDLRELALDITDEGMIQFKASAAWTANATASVVLAALAPAAVTGSAIGKWLTVEDKDGGVYYLPAWT